MKCFIGYAGWTENQLAGEMEAGGWLLHPGNEQNIFIDDPTQWSKVMVQITLGNGIDPRRIPDDPSVN